MKLDVVGLDLSDAVVRQIRLRSVINDLPVLTVSIELGRRIDVNRLTGTPVTFQLHGKPHFRGFVYRGSLSGRLLRIVAWNRAGRRNLAQRTRSYGVKPVEVPIGQLGGIMPLLEGINGCELLTICVQQLFQYAETDWSVLQRIAAWSRLLLVTEPDTGTVSFVKPSETAIVKVIASALRSEQIIEEASFTPQSVKCRSVDLRTGELSAAPAEYSCQHASPSEGLKGLRPHSTEEIFPSRDGLVMSDRQRAESVARAQVSLAYSWQGTTSQIEITAGKRILLPEAFGGAKLLVVGSELCYDLAFPVEMQLRNLISACHENDLPLPGIPATPGPKVTAWGQVCSVVDPANLGRVKVSMPWHDRPCADPATWQGLWSRVSQPFAGQSADQQRRGSVMLPLLLDWGEIEFDPKGCATPWFKGACYTGHAPAPRAMKDPQMEQLIFAMPGGPVFLVRHGEKSGIDLAVRRDDGSDACGISFAHDGTIVITGNVQIRKSVGGAS